MGASPRYWLSYSPGVVYLYPPPLHHLFARVFNQQPAARKASFAGSDIVLGVACTHIYYTHNERRCSTLNGEVIDAETRAPKINRRDADENERRGFSHGAVIPWLICLAMRMWGGYEVLMAWQLLQSWKVLRKLPQVILTLKVITVCKPPKYYNTLWEIWMDVQ